jgi:hypothetical protein
VYGTYAAYTDHEIERVIQAVEDLGELDRSSSRARSTS